VAPLSPPLAAVLRTPYYSRMNQCNLMHASVFFLDNQRVALIIYIETLQQASIEKKEVSQINTRHVNVVSVTTQLNGSSIMQDLLGFSWFHSERRFMNQ